MWESGLEVAGGHKRPHRRFHKVLGTLGHFGGEFRKYLLCNFRASCEQAFGNLSECT